MENATKKSKSDNNFKNHKQNNFSNHKKNSNSKLNKKDLAKSNTQDLLKTKTQEIETLKKQINDLKTKIVNLETQNIAAKIENQKNIVEFQDKAKQLTTKAQEEVSKIKHQLEIKFAEDQKHLKKFTLQKFFETVLNPFTNLLQAVNSAKNSNDSQVRAYVMGFNMYIQQILDDFKSFGLNIIIPQQGDEFNPEFHEVVDWKTGAQKNHIVKLMSPGFQLHERVIKPAKVIIGK